MALAQPRGPTDGPPKLTSSSSSLIHVCELASGGMGRVDLAVRREGGFERLYAVKRLHSQYHGDSEFRAMFLDEARIAGLIRHANVVSVLDVGEDPTGPFLVMDYVEGVSLNHLLEHHAGREELLPVQLCIRLVSQVAEGLHAAHELTDRDGEDLGLVHRDVSPQNILVGYDGVVRVTDFGVAKAFGRLTRTATGVLKGKFGYMSPEQLRFEEPDRRSDLFALGVILYELLSCKRLYGGGEGMESARRILNEPPPDIDDVRQDVPMELIELLFRLLAKDPAHRPATAREVSQRLEQALLDVVNEQGTMDLAEYMDTVFGHERDDGRHRLAAQLRALDQEPGETSGIRAAGTDEDAIETVAERAGLAPARKSSKRHLWAPMGVVLLVLAGGGAYVAATAGPEQMAPPQSLAKAHVEKPPVPDEAPASAPEETNAAHQAESEDPPARRTGRRRRRPTKATTSGRPWVEQW